MKKIGIVFIFAFALVLSGCDAISDAVSGGTDYEKLSNAIVSPSGSQAADLDGNSYTFDMMITSEVFTMESDEADLNGKKYVAGVISREFSTQFCLNVEDIKEVPEVGTVVTVKGKVDGYIYSTSDSGKEEVLNIVAKSMEKKKVEEKKVDKKNTTKSLDGLETYTFKRAQITTDTFGESRVVIYYDIKISNDSIVSSMKLDGLQLTQGETYLEPEFPAIGLEGVDESAMEAKPGGLDKGEKGLVYTTYSGNADTTTPITIRGYDDEFSLIYEYTLNIE